MGDQRPLRQTRHKKGVTKDWAKRNWVLRFPLEIVKGSPYLPLPLPDTIGQPEKQPIGKENQAEQLFKG